jgi:hypothetical protein
VSGRGNGAVWYTEVADFDEVVFEDKENVTGTEYAPYVTDVLRYAQGMGYTVYDTPMNIMTYFGFPGGTGTVGDPFQANPYDPDHANTYKIYSFNKWAAYKEDTGGMPPDFIPTGTVYIIAHHGGLTFSKLQVTDFSLDPDELFYTIGLKFTKVTPAPPARGGGVIGR